MAERTFLVFLFIIVAIVEALLFSIVQAGWSSYIYVLIEQGFYSHLCLAANSIGTGYSDAIASRSTRTMQSNSSQSCVEQQEELNLLYTISQTIIQILMISWGYLTYHYGIIKPKILSMALFIGGILLLGFSSPGYELIIVPGSICIGVGGIAVLILNMKVTTLLDSGTGIYVAILNGASISSVITFRFVKLMYDYGVDYLYPFIGIAVLHLVIGSISLIFHKVLISSTHITEKDIQIPQDEKDQENQSLKDIIFSWSMFFHILWCSILITTMLTYIGTINKRLQDDFPGKVSYYTDMMADIMSGGIISSICVGGLIEWQKNLYKSGRVPEETKALQQVLHLFVSSLLAVILNGLAFVTSEMTLYIEFIILTVFRTLFLSSNMTFVISMYPPKHTIVILPIILSTGGILSSIQYGLFLWYDSYQGAHTHVRIFMTTVAALSLIFPITVLMKGLGMSGSKTCCSTQEKDKSSYTRI